MLFRSWKNVSEVSPRILRRYGSEKSGAGSGTRSERYMGVDSACGAGPGGAACGSAASSGASPAASNSSGKCRWRRLRASPPAASSARKWAVRGLLPMARRRSMSARSDSASGSGGTAVGVACVSVVVSMFRKAREGLSVSRQCKDAMPAVGTVCTCVRHNAG